MKIVTKMFLGFSLLILIAVTVGVFSIIQMNRINKTDAYLYENCTIPIEFLSIATESFERVASNMAYCIYEKDTADYYKISLTQFQELESSINKYEKTINDTTDARLFKEMFSHWQLYKTYFLTLQNYIKSSKYEEADEFRKTDNNLTRRSFRESIQQITTYKTENAKKIISDDFRLQERASLLIYIVLSVGVLAALIIVIWISGSIKNALTKLIKVTRSITEGNLNNNIDISSGDEIGVLAGSVNTMQSFLLNSRTKTTHQDWLKTGYSRLNDVMRGVPDMNTFSFNVITELASWTGAKIGAFYVLSDDGENPAFLLAGSYAFTKRKNLSNIYKPGEGLIGQAALEKQQILLKNVPEDYIRITSGLGEAIPKFICLTPVVHENVVTGVLEIGTLEEMSELQLEYISQCTISIAITLASLKSRVKLDKELQRSKELSEELQCQQVELRASNEELEEQTQLLRQSEETLKNQQEELRVSNEELEEKNQSLQIQKKEITRIKEEVEAKASELSTASKYKSEFLANMSHELRTPLNSLLILSKVLSENKKGNLSQDQVESANVIYRSGNDLLSLINEILDLSKIEAGQMEVNIEKINVKNIAEKIKSDFKHMTDEKGIALNITIHENAPKTIETDMKRLEQIIKNLTSNAIKFTKIGSVTISFKDAPAGVNLFRSGLRNESCFAVSVTDTGIGIPLDKQKIIFEAFQQADGGTAREYGGTGLGLSISRELAAMLGGEIQLVSEPGKGSQFTLYLPLKPDFTKSAKSDIQSEIQRMKEPPRIKPARSNETVADDRIDLKENPSNSILIIEDDPFFAKLLADQAHERGFKSLVGLTGEEGITLAIGYLPTAIVLDLHLPGISGWDVLETLKTNQTTRHIPVHIMSVDDLTIEAFRKGAIGYLIKPPKKEQLDAAFNKIGEIISRPVKDLLVVEDDENLSAAITTLIGNGDVHTKSVATGKNAIKELKIKNYDCMILDLGLPDMTGFELLELMETKGINIPPVIVYTGKDLTLSEEMRLRKHAESIIIKGVKSEERLLDETSLFLHRMVEKFPEQKKRMITSLHDSDAMFRDKKVLVVDDDMRNVFALSKVLSDKGLKILKAEDGMKALETISRESDIDLVIMDIMMPEMDGYETIRRIREQKKFSNLPIIALTAKAMKKDYEQCIAAGANDYMSKPVDITRLISMLRIWLYR
jgi:signal transduction histidine kinase/DNA-binding response OmpR family regulator/HAMP domain-containing protein